MHRVRVLTLFAAPLLVVALVAADVRAQSVVANGGFETPPAAGTTTFAAPATFAGWSVEFGGVALGDTTAWAPAVGAQSLLLAAPDSPLLARVGQGVIVTPGARYRLSLAYADGVEPGPGFTSCEAVGRVMPTRVLWAGEAITLLRPIRGHTTANWLRYATVLTAPPGPSAPLAFETLGPAAGTCGQNLDDVAVVLAAATDTGTRLASSAPDAAPGEPVTFTATVIAGTAGTVPAGTVQFSADGLPLGSAALDAQGVARHSMTALGAGGHEIVASFTPAAGSGLAASEATILQAVAKRDAAVALSVAPDPTVTGQEATFIVAVASATRTGTVPTGSVRLSDADGSVLAEGVPLDAAGRAAVTIASGAGMFDVTAAYSGSNQYNPASATVRQTVRPAATTTALSVFPATVRPGDDVSILVDVQPVPPGAGAVSGLMLLRVVEPQLTFQLVLIDGVATATVEAPDAPGTYTLEALFGPTGNYLASSSSATLVILPAAGAAPPPTGAVAAPAAAGVAPAVPRDVTAPTVRGARLAPRAFAVAHASRSAGRRARGATLRFALSEPARVTLTIESVLAGRRAGRACAAPNAANRSAARCTRTRQAGRLTHSGVRGANAVAFTGRLRGRALAPGSYRLTVVAADTTGNRSGAVTLRFRVVP